MNKAVFLDRDGTVNEEVGYLTDLKKLRLIAGAGAAIKRLNEADFKVVLVTNQSGVARGYFPESLVHDAHKRLFEMLKSEGARVDAVYYCPHHPTAGNQQYTVECDCRKPRTGLIDRAVKDLAIDIRHSYLVGDKWSDIELAQRAGVYGVLVTSGFAHDDRGNIRSEQTKDPQFIAPSLFEAAVWIIAHDLRSTRKSVK
jgi:D-glycero-D-manno-heptose 1,7-bisphosphate phosphatase